MGSLHNRCPQMPNLTPLHSFFLSFLSFFLPPGPHAVDYFRNRCPQMPNLLTDQNPAEYIVDLTTQVGGEAHVLFLVLGGAWDG